MYTDDMKAEPKKGELAKDFGLYIERPFHIVTEMTSGRYLDLEGKNLLLRRPTYGLTSQVFWFDWTSRTVRSEE